MYNPGKYLTRLYFLLILCAPAIGCNTETYYDASIIDKPTEEMSVEEIERMVVIVKTNLGSFRFRLFPREAPEEVNHFITLARKGFYTGLKFHQVRSRFWIVGGDPFLDSEIDPSLLIPFTPNDLPNKRGSVGFWHPMMNPNASGVSFFVMLGDHLKDSNSYVVFGQVIEGMPTLDRIGRVRTTPSDDKSRPYSPLEPVIIEDLRIEVLKK